MTLTTTDFDNAARDLKTVSAVSNSVDPDTGSPIDSYQTRLGDTTDTLGGRLLKLGYLPPVNYIAGISFGVNDNAKTIERESVIYSPLPSALPFVTSGTWVGGDDQNFLVVQDTNNYTDQQILAHNSDAAAHPELSEFITQEADRAEAAADAALLSRGVYDSTTKAIGYGVAAYSNLIGGSGGADGQFDLAFTGGTGSDAAGRFVVSGGSVIDIFITASGSYSVAPSFDFSASAGLTGASAVCVLGRNVDVGEYFSTPSAGSDEYITLYRVDAGPVATAIDDYPNSASIDAVKLDQQEFKESTLKKNNAALSPSGSLFDPSKEGYAEGFFVNWTNGELSASALYNSSDFIDALASTDYYNNSVVHIAWYDAAKVFISGTNAPTQVMQSPAGASFCRFSFDSTEDPNYVIFSEGSSYPSEFPYFGGVINAERVFDIDHGAVKKNGLSSLSMDFCKDAKNLFDINEALIGFFQGSNGIVVANATYFITGLIPVDAGQTYTFRAEDGNNARFLTAYDKAGRVVPELGSDSALTTYTVQNPVKYLKVTGFAGSIDTYQLERGAYYTKFTEHSKCENDKSVSVDGLGEPLFVKGKNLFDKAATLDGIFSGSNGVYGANATYELSDYIEIKPSTTYTYSASGGSMRFYTAYDENKAVVQSEGSDSSSTSFTTPSSGVRYYRITISVADRDLAMLEEGAVATGFEPFRLVASSKIFLPSSNYDQEGWGGVEAISYGDSITAQESWQPTVISALGIDHTAYGVGGRQVSGTSGMNTQANIDALPASAELIMVLGGANDWAQSRALGAVNSTNIEEFYGAYNKMIERLVLKYPQKRILLMTTMYAELPQRVIDGIWTTPDINTQGLTTRDYAEAIITVARRWGVPYVDTAQAGFNTFNLQDYMKDDGGWIHPNNDLGGPRIGEIVVGGLRVRTPS